ncbi:ankyrin repeat domain-containing protein [Marinifilum caeruleilacunae]|uniref:Ankyrin repeat domain-containing protein n=1 Tax=Marinifilum caeruleilacunae TaxID=2499076 RepID=A0ABX1WQD1_9BACT|nr:ankyrin repeat domain-containing protein [Marinifilum caeruleilacunae]NOU58285.1 ankyrin repeat domain-containing protein [Marinifilum caeruleilacunae]
MNTLTKRITISLSIILFVSFLSNAQTNVASKLEGKSDYDQKARTEYSVNDVIAFIYQWFAAFDHQKEVDYYLEHIAEPVDMHFPDFPIKSKDDFKRWYKGVEDNITWNSHALRNIQVSGNEKDGWKASYDVEWKAIGKQNQHFEMIIHQDVELIRKKDILQITQHKAYMKDIKHQDTHLTALMKAAGNGNAELVKDLIEKGANLFTLDPLTGTSVLHFAAQGGNVDVMKTLVDNGAEAIINLQAASNSFSPLMVATWYQNPEMIKYLLSLEHINPNLKDQFGRRADQFPAIAKGYDDYHKIDKEIQSIYKNYFAKYNSYMQDKFEADKTTPKNLPEDVNLRIPNNEVGAGQHTAALVAARDNKIKLFKEMINNGADLTADGEYMKAIVAHKAAYMGNPEIMALIVKHPDFEKIKNAQGPTNGYTPLHDAIWHGHTQTAKILIDAGVDTSIVAWDGMTPYDLAKKLHYSDIMKLLKD